MMTPTIRQFAGFVLVVSGCVLGAAMASQYLGGLRPCELCLMQRWPWAVAITVSLVAVFAGSRAVLPWLALALAVVFGFGVVVAFYHVGVEQHWFAGPTACTAKSGGAMTLEEMKRQILGTAPVLCDRVQWSLFGVSMAGWNCLASLGMTAICGIVFARSYGRTWRTAAAG